MAARMAARMAGGTGISDPAVDVLNENPSLVALGKAHPHEPESDPRTHEPTNRALCLPTSGPAPARGTATALPRARADGRRVGRMEGSGSGRETPFVSIVRMVVRMVVRMAGGSDISAPAVDVLNENPRCPLSGKT